MAKAPAVRAQPAKAAVKSAPAKPAALDPAHAANARLAQAYDTVTYDGGLDPALEPLRLFGLAGLHGKIAAPKDVLDLGCGVGRMLERAGETLTGRLVGVDIAPAVCEQARTRLAPFGDRAEVICADLLDLDEAALGTFDLVTGLGVLYVTPLETQRRLLSLIGRCLKPGGVAVLGYYAGVNPLLRASLYATLRAAAREGEAPGAAVATARANLKIISDNLEGPNTPFIRGAVESIDELPDAVFFHEALGATYDPQQTSTLQLTLAEAGVNFVSYFGARSTTDPASPVQRAIAADRFDLTAGGYRHAIFLKGQAGAMDVRADGVVWSCALSRTTANPGAAEATYFDPRTNLSMTVRGPLLCAFVDAVGPKPLAWKAALAAARLTAGAKAEDETLLAQGLRELWRLGVATPLAVAG